MDYYRGQDNKVLFASPDKWEEMINSLIELKVIKESTINKSVNNDFVNKFHSKK